MEHLVKVSVQDRYLIVDSSYAWELRFNDSKVLKYYSGRYIADLYARIGSEGHGDDILRNVQLYYDDGDKPGSFDWQLSEIPIVELTGVNGQIVQVANWPEVQPVEVVNEAAKPVPVEITNLSALLLSVLMAVYPVGSYWLTEASGDPAGLLGFGTWSLVSGRVLVGRDPADSAFDVVGEQGGSKTHTLSVGEMPSHGHGIPIVSGSEGGQYGLVYFNGDPSGTFPTNSAGGGGAHNNLQPYRVVNMWRRTA
jgi:hypothetical protein